MRTDYKDFIASTENRHYRQIDNDDGTISLVDETVYTQEGDKVSAGVLNELSQNAIWPLQYAKSGAVHQLTGLTDVSGVVSCVFTATADFAEGDTVTVDGTAYTIQLSSGDAPADKLFVSGASVAVVVDKGNKKVNFKAGGGYVKGDVIAAENVENVYITRDYEYSSTPDRTTRDTMLIITGNAYSPLDGSLYAGGKIIDTEGNFITSVTSTANSINVDVSSDGVWYTGYRVYKNETRLQKVSPTGEAIWDLEDVTLNGTIDDGFKSAGIGISNDKSKLIFLYAKIPSGKSDTIRMLTLDPDTGKKVSDVLVHTIKSTTAVSFGSGVHDTDNDCMAVTVFTNIDYHKIYKIGFDGTLISEANTPGSNPKILGFYNGKPYGRQSDGILVFYNYDGTVDTVPSISLGERLCKISPNGVVCTPTGRPYSIVSSSFLGPDPKISTYDGPKYGNAVFGDGSKGFVSMGLYEGSLEVRKFGLKQTLYGYKVLEVEK